MKVPSNILNRQYLKYAKEYNKKLISVLENGYYINGPEVENFEKEFADFCNAKYAVGLASGLDALRLALEILGIKQGDEVLVQSNAYIATVMSITLNGATPIFVEPDQYYNMDPTKIESKITPHTKAILVTHLYGQSTDMSPVVKLAKKHNLSLVEDCAQAHGVTYNNQPVGTFGIIGCFSFYPSKNLGAFGDGGGIITNDPKIAEKFKIYRNYGSEKRHYNQVIGLNSRLDEIQAALLRIKLSHFHELQKERDEIAKKYLKQITNPAIVLPSTMPNSKPNWHQFVIRTAHRDELQSYLEQHGISTIIHYPIPPHLSEAYEYLGYHKGDFPIAEAYADTVLSLPIYNGMTAEEQNHVIKTINEFVAKDKK